MSELARKLAAMKSRPRETQTPPPAPELVTRTFSRPMDARLLEADPSALRRMGLEGDICWEKTAFLDTETTGLSQGAGTVAFLVGIGRIRDGQFTVTQLFMPDYTAENALLLKTEELLDGVKTLVTFNGKNFDIPLLATRRVMCRMAQMPDFCQWDLLYPARRVWKLRIKSCRLAHIEDVILDMRREDDLPGSEAPERYFAFLKTGDFQPLEAVIEHNRQDVLVMETLLAELFRVYGKPRENTEQLDLFSLGKTLEKQRDSEEAAACYQKAAVLPPSVSVAALTGREYARESGLHLARLHLRAGDIESAQACLEKMASRPGWAARTQLAKLLEHKKREYGAALRYARLALEDAKTWEEEEDARKRVARLTRKKEG